MTFIDNKPQNILNVTVYYDLSKGADEERCIVRPNTVVLPQGTFRLVWNLITVGPGAESDPAQFHDIDFGQSPLPVAYNEAVSTTQWHAKIHNPGGEFRPLPYHIGIDHGGETSTCYPHCVGSPDQGGG